MRIFRYAVVSLLGLVFASATLAQTSTSSLRGTVKDAAGAVIQGAEVSVVNPETNYSRAAKTDAQGNYQFLQLPPGTYTLKVSSPGFASVTQGVQLLVDTPATVNVTLDIAMASTTLEVSGEAPTVNTQDATLGNAFNPKQVASLPFEGRDPVGILSLQAGVAYVGENTDQNLDSRSGAVTGARSDQTNVTLDGIDNNDQTRGYALRGALRTTLDSLQEFRVVTTNSNADSGRSSGAQVSLVTKGGTNRFHGSAYEYHRPTMTVANDWFNKQAQLRAGESNRPPKVIRNTFGGSLGGPIIKDRVFFFLNYEGQRTRENAQTTRIVPSMAMRQGVIQYLSCGKGQPTSCDNPTQLVTLSPGQIKSMDPLGIGPNTAILDLLNSYPTPNSMSVGDTLNFQGYTFAANTPASLNTYIAKIDVNLKRDGSHRLFVRGNLQNDNQVPGITYSGENSVGGAPQFPGQPANEVDTENSKGLAVGYSATFTTTFLNNLRYGFIRQGLGSSGTSTQPFVHLRGLSDAQGFTRFSNFQVPVHNLADDVTLVRGNHTVQFGGNFRRISNLQANDTNSFFHAVTNPSWLAGAGIAGTDQGLDPAAAGLPPVADSFINSFDYPIGALVGIVAQVDSNYIRDKTGTALPQGTPVQRHYRANELEFYLQDAWRARPNLTLTAGLRYSLLQPPYEVHGIQVQPTTSVNEWMRQRWLAMEKGLSFADPITFDLSGQANGRKPYWAWDYKNIAPRLAFAYSPSFESGWLGKLFGGAGRSSIRGGYGIYFDHFGEGIVNTFDQFGSFGLTTSLTNPGGELTTATAPRFTGLTSIPSQLVKPAPAGGFPVTYPDIYATTWGLDDRLKTPYSHVIDFSITRELPRNFVFEVSYVGRLGRRLLQQDDMAMPLNPHDPKSGMDYFTAATKLSQMVDAGTNINNVARIPFWENYFPAAAGGTVLGCAPGAVPGGMYTATQSIYDMWICTGSAHNETTALQNLDTPYTYTGDLCYPACSTVNGQYGPYHFFSPQFNSLYAWRSIGVSSYHGMLVSLRHRLASGLQFDFNYTLSKSMDMGSDAERITEWGGLGGVIINAWSPRQKYGLSDFDARHQINANWTYELPVGRGKRWGGSWNGFLNALAGGWAISGLARWANSYPTSIGSGYTWATNWQLSSNAVQIGPMPATGTYMDAEGDPNLFKDPTQANKAFRMAFAGESGQRNNIYGPGYFGIDGGVSKAWQLAEGHNLKFSWEVFNTTNSVRFDGATATTSLDAGPSFGKYGQTVTNKRVMQFALRYEF